jgi:ATP-binding cassette subfamily F protein 3
MLAAMEPAASIEDDPSLVFNFPSPKELKPPLIVLEDVAVGYAPGKPVLSRLNLRFDPDDRVALVGRNGNGKTTLARLLAGQLAPQRGAVVASSKLRAGYFAQHQVEELVLDETPLQHMERAMRDAKPGAARAQLGRFGFSGDKAMRAVRTLSGGERARLALALITRDAPHILILDEPTNHLDVDARDALIEALAGFGGAVIMVSHDRHLVGLVADRLILVDGGTATPLEATLDDYRDMVLASGRRGSDSSAKSDGASRAEQRRGAAETRQKNSTLRKAAKAAEAELDRLWRRLKEIDAALSQPNGKAESIATLMKTRAELDRQVAAAERRWLEASEAAERASTQESSFRRKPESTL